MHELAICQSLLREVERTAAAHGGREVTAVVVSIGPLSGVEPGALSRAFSVACGATVAGRAALRIETVPVVVWCAACRRETRTAPNALICGHCGAWRIELVSGDELLLKQVELTIEESDDVH